MQQSSGQEEERRWTTREVGDLSMISLLRGDGERLENVPTLQEVEVLVAEPL
jgi:hypothetical protein